MRILKKFFSALVAEEIEKRISQIPLTRPPQGYNSTESLRGALFQWVLVPFNGVPVWCKLRCLNSTQQEACGSVTLINGLRELTNEGAQRSLEKLIDIRNIQERLVSSCMVEPTFDEIFGLVIHDDSCRAREVAALEEVKKTDLSSLDLLKKKEVQNEIDRLELAIAFIIPDDAMNFLTNWVLGLDVSDIKTITKDVLLQAAILADKGKDNPSDHVRGVFTDRDKTDIDKSAWRVYNEYLDMKKLESDTGKHRFIGGGGK